MVTPAAHSWGMRSHREAPGTLRYTTDGTPQMRPSPADAPWPCELSAAITPASWPRTVFNHAHTGQHETGPSSLQDTAWHLGDRPSLASSRGTQQLKPTRSPRTLSCSTEGLRPPSHSAWEKRPHIKATRVDAAGRAEARKGGATAGALEPLGLFLPPGLLYTGASETLSVQWHPVAVLSHCVCRSCGLYPVTRNTGMGVSWHCFGSQNTNLSPRHVAIVKFGVQSLDST